MIVAAQPAVQLVEANLLDGGFRGAESRASPTDEAALPGAQIVGARRLVVSRNLAGGALRDR